MVSQLHLAAVVVTRRKPVQKSVSSPSVMQSRPGIRRTSVRRCGSFIIRRSTKAKASVFSQFPTGLRRISGSILREKISPIVPLYFAKERPVVYRDGNIIMVDDDRMRLNPGEEAADEKGPFPYSWMLSSDRWYRV